MSLNPPTAAPLPQSDCPTEIMQELLRMLADLSDGQQDPALLQAMADAVGGSLPLPPEDPRD